MPLNQFELFEIYHKERLRIVEQRRLMKLAMESQQPRRPGIISRWMAALKALATLRATAPLPAPKRPVVLAHESGSFRIR